MNKFGKLWIGASAAMLLAVPSPVHAETLQPATAAEEALAVEEQQPVEQAPAVEEQQPVEQPTEQAPAVEEQQPVEQPIEQTPAVEEQQPTEQAPAEQAPVETVPGNLAEGWGTDEFGNKYYVKNGEKVVNQVLLIENAYYGFDWDGKMYVNTNFSIFDSNTNQDFYYRAKPDGTLYVKEWYEDVLSADYSNWYYYGEAGVAYSGFHEMAGHLYYFCENGQILRDTMEIIGGEIYIFDENGYGVKLNKNGWTQVGADWYYTQNGEVIKDKVLHIDGAYYGFDWNGRMYVNTEFTTWDSNTSQTFFHRAKADGKLYVEEWYEEVTGVNYKARYYYGAGGMAYKGIHEISGHLYGFTDNGLMYSDTVVKIENVNYVFDENGHGTKLEKDGWNQAGKDWYYVQNGNLISNQILEIGNDSYYFNWDGKMSANEVLGLWDEASQKHNEIRSKADGRLYKSEWYDDGWTKYYFGADCFMYVGLHEIDGKLYGFHEYGSMITDTIESIEGKTIYFDVNGWGTELPDNSWSFIENNWYYVQNGQILKNCVAKINNGSYYGFDEYGRMQTGNFTVYDSATGERSEYLAREDGSLYVNEWFLDLYREWHYFGTDGKAARGYTCVDGVYYYFSQYGIMVKDSLVTDESGNAYQVDSEGIARAIGDGWHQDVTTKRWIYVENGKAIENGMRSINGVMYAFQNTYMCDDEIYINDASGDCYLVQKGGAIITTPGWNKSNGEWYYVGNAGVLHKGILKDGGNIYYMNPHMVHNTQIVKGEDGKTYMADRNGYLTEITTDGFYQSTDGFVYYIKQGTISKEKWESIDGYWYYFDASGVRVSDSYSYQIGNSRYAFAEDGKMYANAWVARKGGYECSYASASGAFVVGEQYIDGKWYCFNEFGGLYTGLYEQNGKHYLYGSDGVYIGEIASEGWNLLNGSYYYVQNGNVVRYRTLKIGNEIYGFDSAGKMFKNEIAFVQRDKYYFDNSGAAKRGWIYELKQYYYGDPETGALITDMEKEIDGAIYRFDYSGVMMTGEVRVKDKWYHYSSSGARTSVTDFPNGWSLCGDEYYYYQDGKAFTGWVGDYYIRDGVMLRNQRIELNGNEYYYLDHKGRYLRNQWIYFSENMYMTDGEEMSSYVKSDGRVAFNEWVFIDGNWYYFSYPYYTTGYKKIDGKDYWFDDNGKYLGEKVESDGWLYKNNHYYYIHAGEAVRNQMLYIDNDWYCFKANGQMVSSQIYYSYSNGRLNGCYFDSTGRKVNYKGWEAINGRWYYFDSESNLVDGFVQVGNKWYYTNAYQGMVTGYHVIDGQLYHFDSSGACIEKIRRNNEWYLGNGEWYYFENGELVLYGTKNIGGTRYFFVDGKLAKEGVFYENGEAVHVNNAGVVDTTKGWKMMGNQWIYVKSNGRIATGIERIDGTEYYFSRYGIWQK